MTMRRNAIRGEVKKRSDSSLVGIFYYIDLKGRDASKAYYILLKEPGGEVEIFPYIDFTFKLLHTPHQAKNISKVGDSEVG